MQDAPTAHELIEAVTKFLSSEIAPTLSDPRLRFRALVAANVLTIVGRELELGEAQILGEWQRLQSLMPEQPLTPDRSFEGRGGDVRADVEHMTRELAQKIRAGDADESAFHDAVFAHVEQTVMEKLLVANPKYLERVSRER